MDRSGRMLITGICGQDGWYLAKRLLELGHSVVGTTHRAGVSSVDVDGAKVPVVQLALEDGEQIRELVRTERPVGIFNLAARASSAELFDAPLATAQINGMSVAYWLEAIRTESPRTRFCQASSSEIFAGAECSPQDETTAPRPLSAYGAAKAYAGHLVSAYRSTHSLFACTAILFSHESPRRPSHFLVPKVTRAAARIARGEVDHVTIGDLDAVRDWGYAADYVEAMRRMLAADEPADFVVATGEVHTVRQVCEIAFTHLGLDWQRHVDSDERFKRPVERVARVGNSERARRLLGWSPACSFRQLVTMLVDAERGRA